MGYALEARDLSIGYKQPKEGWSKFNPRTANPVHWVIKGLNFGVEPNSFTLVTGISGAGKTTLLKALSIGKSRNLVVEGEVISGRAILLGSSIIQSALNFNEWYGISDPGKEHASFSEERMDVLTKVLTARGASVVLMDEPFLGMKYELTGQAVEILSNLKKGSRRLTAIYTTQNPEPSLIDLTDNILVIDKKPRFGSLKEMRRDEYVKLILTDSGFGNSSVPVRTE